MSQKTKYVTALQGISPTPSFTANTITLSIRTWMSLFTTIRVENVEVYQNGGLLPRGTDLCCDHQQHGGRCSLRSDSAVLRFLVDSIPAMLFQKFIFAYGRWKAPWTLVGAPRQKQNASQTIASSTRNVWTNLASIPRQSPCRTEILHFSLRVISCCLQHRYKHCFRNGPHHAN